MGCFGCLKFLRFKHLCTFVQCAWACLKWRGTLEIKLLLLLLLLLLHSKKQLVCVRQDFMFAAMPRPTHVLFLNDAKLSNAMRQLGIQVRCWSVFISNSAALATLLLLYLVYTCCLLKTSTRKLKGCLRVGEGRGAEVIGEQYGCRLLKIFRLFFLTSRVPWDVYMRQRNSFRLALGRIYMSASFTEFSCFYF